MKLPAPNILVAALIAAILAFGAALGAGLINRGDQIATNAGSISNLHEAVIDGCNERNKIITKLNAVEMGIQATLHALATDQTTSAYQRRTYRELRGTLSRADQRHCVQRYPAP